jgi:hypothetical protein
MPAPLVPIFLPNNPDIIALNKGINNTNIYIAQKLIYYIYKLIVAS